MAEASKQAQAAPRGVAVRCRAATAVSGVLHSGRRLEEALDYQGLGRSDRALLRELATGTVRWAIRLRTVLDDLLDRPLPRRETEVEALLLVGLYQLAHTNIPPYAAVSATVGALSKSKAWARRLINGVLRRFGREPGQRLAAADARSVGVANAHPEWLVIALEAAYPDAWQGVLDANNQAPPLTLRVVGDRAAYLAELAAAGIEAQAHPLVETAVNLKSFRPVASLPGFPEGRASVQDAAAQLAAPLMETRSGERVLDACTAPGGKLAHLLSQTPDLHVTALDPDSDRLDRTRETLERTGLAPEALLRGDAARPQTWWDGVPFDRILIDAPCSGSGVIRRHPDIKHLRRPEDVGPMEDRQQALLEGLWPILRPGGKLLYVTCSVLPEENGERVAALQQAHPEARAEPLPQQWGRPAGPGCQILPGEAGTDGFYYARLRKETP
ncbi:16S rRNA (cytosine(967)-C(5))-methyltransferase RsmB [Thiohalorhabdus sp.]|uniref:16S rRNA (cytosine(967)-C(5))-methyltransferase RsmB n=1 Tax=Thiohalorhabdus sp. TaxID=3094134 RepID=UPI002FC37370